MQALRELEWRAIFAGIGTLIGMAFVIPLLLIASIPLIGAVPDLAPIFIWISDATGGRILTFLVSLLASWYVAYRVASQRKALHGFLAPGLLFFTFWLIGLVLIPMLSGTG